jgi:MFS family permease
LLLAASETPHNRIWTRDYTLVILSTHFLFACYSSLFTIIPPYVLARGGQEWQIGIVIGAFGVSGVIFRPLAGRLANRFGPKRIAIAGALLLAAGSILYIPATSVWLIVPVRALQGIGLGIGPVATTTMVANLAPAHRRGEALSYMGNSIALASMYSSVVAYWLLTQYGFPASFTFSGICGFVSLALSFFISAEKTRIHDENPGGGSVPFISRRALFPTFVFLSYTITTAPVNTFLPLLAEQRSLGNPGLYFTVYSFTSMLAMLGSGALADRLGRPAVIIPGLLLTAAAMFLLMASVNQIMFLSAALLVGVGFGLLQPGTQSFTVDRVPPRERASALATLQQAWDIGGSGGAFLLGPIAGVVGIGAAFGLSGLCTVAGVTGFVIGNHRRPTPMPSPVRQTDTTSD